MGFCWGARKTEEEKKIIFETRTSEETSAHIFPCIQNTKDTKVHVEKSPPISLSREEATSVYQFPVHSSRDMLCTHE